MGCEEVGRVRLVFQQRGRVLCCVLQEEKMDLKECALHGCLMGEVRGGECVLSVEVRRAFDALERICLCW